MKFGGRPLTSSETHENRTESENILFLKFHEKKKYISFFFNSFSYLPDIVVDKVKQCCQEETKILANSGETFFWFKTS